MTTTNVYQGVQDKSTSRVLRAPGGGSSGIFGHYQEQADNDRARENEMEKRRVEQSLIQGGQGDQGTDHFQRDKDSFNANRHRNQGSGAPFATSDSMVSADIPKKYTQMQGVVGDDYETPQQRQAQNPNKGQNTFNNLFGDTEGLDGDGANGKAKGKVATHNPVTWQAYSNYDAARDKPQHRSRYESHAAVKSGTFNPITGKEYTGESGPPTRVKAPPGGQSSIQF